MGTFIHDFYLVAYEIQSDQSINILGFELIDHEDNFDRIGPEIGFTPVSADILLEEKGAGSYDELRVRRIYPPGTPFAGMNALPEDSIPFIFILADNDDDEFIDVYAPNFEDYIIAVQPLNVYMDIPFPGSMIIGIGDNHWDAATQTVVGHKTVFVALMDQYGNLSPNPIPVNLDVFIEDPDPSLITATGTVLVGMPGAVEENATVSFFENPDMTGLIATTTADSFGGFYISGLAIKDRNIHIFSRDRAGNVSNIIEIPVTGAIEDAVPVVMDALGTIHTPDIALNANSSSLAAAVDIESPSDNPSVFYMLHENGEISLLGGVGDEPVDSQQLSLSKSMLRTSRLCLPIPSPGTYY